MGEIKEFKKSEIVIIEMGNKTYIGEASIVEGVPDIGILFNPCLMNLQILPQPSKLGGVEFITLFHFIKFPVDCLNIEIEDNTSLIWGITTDKQIIDQYHKSVEDSKQKKIINA